MKIYYDESRDEYMTETEFEFWASGYIDGVRDAGRDIDDLPTMNEVMLNADHIRLVCDVDTMVLPSEHRKYGYDAGYNAETEARKC